MVKRYVLYILFLGLFTSVYGQSNMNPTAKTFLKAYERAVKSSSDEEMKQLVKDYDLLKRNGEYHLGVLSLVEESSVDTEKLNQLGVINDTKLQNLWTFRVPLTNLNAFFNTTGILFSEVGEPVSELLDDSRPDARVDTVHMGLGGLSRSYSGKGVVVAVIDWGFDYTHPVFYDSTLSNYRVVSAWDQNKIDGNPPNGYNFGTEYLGKSELLAAGSDTNYVFGYSSHGTHVAGIAGGSGGGTQYVGAAPDADLIFISLRRDAPSLIDAFSYITNYAASVNKPYVVNMSFGSHLGPHDGTSMKNLGIDILHGPGKVFVGSAGNNGTISANFHLDKDFATDPDDTLTTVVNFGNVSDQFGQTLSMWGSEFSDFEASIGLYDAGNQLMHEMPFQSSLDEPNFIDTIILNTSDSLIIRMQSTSQFFLNNKPNIRLEVKNTSPYKVVLKTTSSNSHLHIWNNVRMNNRYTNWGVSLSANFPGAVAGNNEYGLGEPAGVGKNVITVGSYRAEFTTPNETVMYGNISSFSSYGPTVDERVKPDISSTGQSVMSSVNSFDITQPAYSTFEFEGREYGFAGFSGTSMSGPMVVGIVALMLEANPNLSAVQAKQILKETARLDDKTGNIGPNGHLQWGWGKANALTAVKAAEVYANVENIAITADLFTLFPNPASSEVNIKLDTDKANKIEEIELFQVDGKNSKLIEGPFDVMTTISTDDLPNGMYIVRVRTEQNFSMKRLMISK